MGTLPGSDSCFGERYSLHFLPTGMSICVVKP